jgi:hypothetical protein
MIWHSVHNYETCLLYNFLLLWNEINIACYFHYSTSFLLYCHFYTFQIRRKNWQSQNNTKSEWIKDFGDNLLTDKIVASPLHLRSYTWNCFMAHLPVLFGRQRKHLQAANRNATMGCPPGNRLPTPSTPLAAIKKLGGALWAPPGAPGYTPLPITSIGCNDRIMKPVFVHAVQFYKLSLGL